MGRYNFAPQRVYQTATRLLETNRLPAPPPWYNVVANLPPSQRLVRPALQGSRNKGKKASKMFQPVKLEYEEDQLRADFFGDHPWELARPRQVLEDDGKDYQRLNWSRLEQPTKQLDGESVVQRQAWLMGLIRHEMDFSCSKEVRDYLRSPAFQQDVRQTLQIEHSIDLECNVPAEGQNPEQETTIAIRLTYHPDQPHDFNAAKRQITSLLASHGITSSQINRRTLELAFPASDTLTQALQSTDFSPILKQYQIHASLGEPIPSHNLQTITLRYHRNFTPSLAATISSLATSLSLPLSSLVHKPLPNTDPDTAPAYSKCHAYDIARKEFYDARHSQEIERRVAREEALFTGAQFGPGALEVGMLLEDQKFEEWKVWAAKEVQTQKQLAGSAYTGLADETAVLEVDDDATQEGLDELADVVPASRKGQEAKGGALVHP